MRKPDSIRDKELSRRQYAQILAGMGAAGLAGCQGGGDGGDGGSTDASTDTDSGGMDGGSGDSETDTATDAPPVTDTIRFPINNTPETFNWNPWPPQDNTGGDLYLSEIHGLRNVHTTNTTYSGTTVPTPHKPDQEEIEVMTWIEDYEIDPPYDWRDYHDDRSMFWNGDPFDAVARETHNHVNYFNDGNKFAEGATFNQEAEDQWTIHYWKDKGSVPNQDPNPVSRAILNNDAGPIDGDPPLHPDFTEPYLEQFQEASSEEAVNGIIDELRSDRVGFERMALDGDEQLAGSGLFVLESMDDVGSESAVFTKRDDHPNADNTNVEQMEIYWAEADRQQTLYSNGELDLGDGAITPSGNLNREALPDHIQEVTRWLRSTSGDLWQLNWNNEHLQNLWVRRALIEAVDWNAVSANGWGEEGSQVLEHDTFMLDAISESTFSEEFLSNLHTYSRSSNTSRANEYMRKAGYTKQGGQWIDRNGNPAEIDMSCRSGTPAGVQGSRTITNSLQSWGFGVNFTTMSWSSWNSSIDPNSGLNYDSTMMWHQGNAPFAFYHDRGAWWNNPLVAGSPTNASPYNADPEDEFDTQGKPIVQQVPTEAGAIEAPDEAGPSPDLSIESEEVNLVETVDAIREPGNSEEDLQELYRTCARYYNFYVPHFPFHQYLHGAFGNVRDFNWPSSGARALDYERSFGIPDVLMQGGIVQASTDTDFPEPE